ncbi:MAG: site-specific integrase [Pelomonas sp.]|nr:site-specific integrase [Roseateles sp.]
MPLTDAAVRNAKPSEKPKKLADGGGLYLEVRPEGGKWWRWRYRFAGREKLLSVGVYPDIGLGDARAKRDELRKLLASGVDPSVARKSAKLTQHADAANSFEALAREWHAAKLQGAPHLVPLPVQAVTALRELEPLTGRCAYVFRGERHHDRPMSENTVNAALRAMGFAADEVTGHGFRATARTMLVERLGFDETIVEAQLAHSVRDNLGRAYNRTEFIDQRRAMMTAWANYLDALAQGGKVVPIAIRAA